MLTVAPCLIRDCEVQHKCDKKDVPIITQEGVWGNIKIHTSAICNQVWCTAEVSSSCASLLENKTRACFKLRRAKPCVNTSNP